MHVTAGIDEFTSTDRCNSSKTAGHGNSKFMHDIATLYNHMAQGMIMRLCNYSLYAYSGLEGTFKPHAGIECA